MHATVSKRYISNLLKSSFQQIISAVCQLTYSTCTLFALQKDFFQLKELEKSCQKEKGITSMSVKDILQSLVDDGMVDTDKIGTSVYFWAFPSKAGQNVSFVQFI
jgi:Mnd1 HTH domain